MLMKKKKMDVIPPKIKVLNGFVDESLIKFNFFNKSKNFFNLLIEIKK